MENNNNFKIRIEVTETDSEPKINWKILDKFDTFFLDEIDFSQLSLLPTKVKAELLYHIATGIYNPLEPNGIVRLASFIVLIRIKNDDFIPSELDPRTWEW